MNTDNLTIAQAREIANLFGVSSQPKIHPFIGRYVIARCYAAGVHAGTLGAVDGENVILLDSIRLWSWKAQDGVALSGVAQNGIQRDKCKLDSVNPTIYLTGVCELIPCSEKARGSIHG